MATCPAGPFPDNTWAIWKGPVPQQLTQFAVADLREEAAHPYGYTWTMTYNGEQVLAIKQHHTWTYWGGKLVTGICIPGVTLYKPKKIGITELGVDTDIPDQDLAWFDNGAETNWWIVGACIAIITTAVLFYFGLRKFRKP